MSKPVKLNLEIVAEPTFGIWCDQCMLPSAVEMLVAWVHGGRLVYLGPATHCSGCEAKASA